MSFWGRHNKMRKPSGQCNASFVEPNTKKRICCQKVKEHEKMGLPESVPHECDGFRWRGDNPVEEHGLAGLGRFCIDGLWLTNGGRIVKPGPGEYAADKCGDILLMSVSEIQDGIPLDVFEQRLNQAKMARLKFAMNKIAVRESAGAVA